MEENLEQKVQEDTAEFVKQEVVQNVIKDNKIEFDIDGIKYRVNRPTFDQKQQTVNARTRKYLALLKDTDEMTESDLIKLYESRGISIADLDRQIDNLQSQRNELSLKLGSMLAENKSEEEIKPVKEELEKTIVEQNKPLVKKSMHLESSIEAQVNVYTFIYLGALITERYVKGKDLGNDSFEPDPGWNQAWASYDDLIKQPEVVVNKVVWFTAMVGKNELPLL